MKSMDKLKNNVKNEKDGAYPQLPYVEDVLVFGSQFRLLSIVAIVTILILHSDS